MSAKSEVSIQRSVSPSFAGRSSGVAMIAALALMAVASGIMVLMFMRTMDDIRHGRDDTAIVQTLLAAQGGMNLGRSIFQNDIKDVLTDIVSARFNQTQSWAFGSSGINDLVPTAASVASDLAGAVAEAQQVVDSLLCDPVDLGSGLTLTVRIHVTATACEEALPPGTHLSEPRFVSGTRRELGGNQRYGVPFVIVADGVMGEFRRRVVTIGEAQFVVGPRSFARYALFTDFHSYGGAGRIYFTERTLFDGPVHTNGNFNFFRSPWFGGPVSSAGVTGLGQQGAFGHPGVFVTAGDLYADADPQNPNVNGSRPVFSESIPDWTADYIPLPDNAFDQRLVATSGNGLHFGDELESLVLFAADADGEPIGAGEVATYQIIEATDLGGVTSTYRLSADDRLEMWDETTETWLTQTTAFNGVIYADEYIRRIESAGRSNASDPDTATPALASFAQLTIVPEVGARITGDLTYESPPCEGSLTWVGTGDDRTVSRPVCSDEALEALNVLGIFAPDGDIIIGNNNAASVYNAPDDVRIHASLMASTGVVTVEDYNLGSPRGQVELLGGIIEREYGPFGTFSSATGLPLSGYGRQFTYDPRLMRGLTPPYFPTVEDEQVTDVQTLTFGAREQIY